MFCGIEPQLLPLPDLLHHLHFGTPEPQSSRYTRILGNGTVPFLSLTEKAAKRSIKVSGGKYKLILLEKNEALNTSTGNKIADPKKMLFKDRLVISLDKTLTLVFAFAGTVPISTGYRTGIDIP
jgi:hypothetical protein